MASTSSSDLTTLQSNFQTQSDVGRIVLNATTLQTDSGLSMPTGLDALLQSALLPEVDLQSIALTVSGSSMSFTLSNSNQTLTVGGGRVSVINLVAVPVILVFENVSGTLQFSLNCTPPQWNFGQSFATIAGVIESLLDLKDVHLIFSTQAQTGFVWNPSQPKTMDLVAGLNFVTDYDLANQPLLKSFFQWGASSFTLPTVTLQGSIEPPTAQAQAQVFPSLDIQASITGSPSLSFPSTTPILVFQSPTLSLESDGFNAPNVFLNMQISIGSGTPVVLDTKVALLSDSHLFRVYVGSSSQVGTQQIFDLIPGGQTVWSNLPPFLITPLSVINFLSFSADFFLGTSPTVTSFQAAIGSTKPLSLFDQFTIDTLLVNWTCLNPLSRSPQNLLSFQANFELLGLDFDISISSDETIYGSCQGNLDLKDLVGLFNKQDNNGQINPPFDVSLSQFQLSMNPAQKVYTFGATANADLKIMDQEILSLTNTQISVEVQQVPKPGGTAGQTENQYTATLNGMLDLFGLDFEVEATIGNEGVDTTFEIHMVNRTLGELLQMLVQLVSRDSQAVLPFPWSKLNDIQMDALVLQINATQHEVTISYSNEIDLGFIQINSLTLSYKKDSTTGVRSTLVSLDCSFFGKSYSSADGNALAWDPINGQPPAVPDKGTVVDIRYLALGQHISPSNVADTKDMQTLLASLENIAPPPPRPLVPGLPTSPAATRPLSNLPYLKYNSGSNWFIGADLTIMDAISLGLIFNDPELYGLIIALSGPKVKSLAGLQFEILYRKINDSIGEYYLELKLPTAMRHLEMGEVSITLPVIAIAIYTNGNFEIDFGFPWNNDFSRSFGLQVFPFCRSWRLLFWGVERSHLQSDAHDYQWFFFPRDRFWIWSASRIGQRRGGRRAFGLGGSHCGRYSTGGDRIL